MEATSALECKELYLITERLQTLCNVIRAYKDTPKALQTCAKLADCVRKSLARSKAPVPANDLLALQWRCNDLKRIVKRLARTKNARLYGKAAEDLETLARVTQEELLVLQKGYAVRAQAVAAGEEICAKKCSAGDAALQ